MITLSDNKWDASEVADKISKQLFSKVSNPSKKGKSRKKKKSIKTITSPDVKNKTDEPKKFSKKKKKLNEVNNKEKKLNTKIKKTIKQNNPNEKNHLKANLKKKMKYQNKKETKQNLKQLNVQKGGIDIEKINKLLLLKKKDSVSEKSQSLRDRMVAQLRASRFRFLNETLYKNESSESKKMFKEDPDAFRAYHDGYQQQVDQWPLNPLDVIIAAIKKMPKDNIIADFGCGEAKLAASVPHKVHSFDLVAVNDRVTACDMSHTPLLIGGVHVVVFCLSLMGTNLKDYLREANRVLKKDGVLKIAEVESRFDNIDEFIKLLGSFGFKNTWKDLSHNLFYFMDFKKIEDINMKNEKLPQITLKPCLYKKR